MSGPVPAHVELAPDGLRLHWEDGPVFLGAQVLRAACRCGACRARGVPGEAAAAVRLSGAAPVGSYALQLVFSDGHDRGIYPWAWLHAQAQSRA